MGFERAREPMPRSLPGTAPVELILARFVPKRSDSPAFAWLQGFAFGVLAVLRTRAAPPHTGFPSVMAFLGTMDPTDRFPTDAEESPSADASVLRAPPRRQEGDQRRRGTAVGTTTAFPPPEEGVGDDCSRAAGMSAAGVKSTTPRRFGNGSAPLRRRMASPIHR
jgi:hypothetical protein